MQELSLWAIDDGLNVLLEYQQERMGDTDDPPSAEERAALQAEIAKYLEALPKKVDGVAGWFRSKESQLSAILGFKIDTGARKGGEIARLRAIAADIEGQVERVKSHVAEVLERQPKPAKGSRKLVGATGSQLILKGNGGVEPLVISQPELIPDELCEWSGKINHTAWCFLLSNIREESMFCDLGLKFKREPSNSLIREALIQPCATCDGSGAKIAPAGPYPEFTSDECPSCGGTGRRGVPGAHLGQRGASVVVK